MCGLICYICFVPLFIVISLNTKKAQESFLHLKTGIAKRHRTVNGTLLLRHMVYKNVPHSEGALCYLHPFLTLIGDFVSRMKQKRFFRPYIIRARTKIWWPKIAFFYNITRIPPTFFSIYVIFFPFGNKN